MPTALERIGGLLYRAGMRHEDGNTSMVAYAAGPTRIVAGELAASVADVLMRRARGRSWIDGRLARRPPIGPSTP